MNQLRNSVQLIGRVGQSPEFKNFDNGNLIKFSLATNEYYNKEGEKVQDTQWHNIIAWGKTAQHMERIIEKGNEVLVKGKLTYNKYEDKDGNTRYMPQVVVNEFIKLEKREALIDIEN